MKKTVFIGMIFALVAGVSLSVFSASYSQKQIQFVDERGEPRTDLTYVKVWDAGTNTASTLKGNIGGTIAVTNPMTPSSTNTGLRPENGLCTFFSTKSKHDVEAMVGGVKVKFKNVKPSDTYFMVPYITRPGAVVVKGGYDTFQNQPICVADAGGGPATGTTGDVDYMYTGAGLYEYHIKGTQTILGPVRVAGGLNIGMDQTADDGVEICPGVLAGHKQAFTVGTDGPFYFTVKFSIADVSGTDDCAIGFRKVEAYQAAIDNYDEMAALNVISGNIYTETILNNAATVATDTTEDWADGETHILGVYVDRDGAVTYTLDGVAPATTVAYSFDAGEVVTPFIYMLNDTDLAGEINLIEWDCALED